ncbi:DivIVA domain-containing protein [Ructibacterium gallinarum]|uniref:DivIVA domain-containing protein n=1 Tax=Ructibacterium gallinarum TaxID=2779355 RepID=A0A9D5M3Q8_9FIRM|nr:DivIVA domain-containing protein [Ructibacterium gallinarum]MBE5040973.1 DivIVA domain-containing protein [Ructibacterium gallinarum]
MLTPQDIRDRNFKRRMRGYDVDEVEEFLQDICDDYEKLYKENLTARERIGMLSDAVKQYKSMEDTLQNALSVAQRSGEDVKKNAYGKAENIIKDAENQAAEIINHAAGDVARVTYQYEQMKRSVEVFRAKVVSLLNAQLDIIKDYSEIQIDEETIQEAKAVYEKNLRSAEDKQSEQDTDEIPLVEKNEAGEYVAREK